LLSASSFALIMLPPLCYYCRIKRECLTVVVNPLVLLNLRSFNALRAVVNLAQGIINAVRPWWSMAGGGVVSGKNYVFARFCPLSLHCACLFLPLLPASSVCLICLSYLPPVPCLPFLPPLLPLLPALHGQGRYAAPPGII
jgi:hypothetical protein